MYRRVIEHPDYLPEEIRKHTDFESGKGLGRIWRLTAATPSPAVTENSAPKQLADLSNDKLVALLSHPNGWTCDTAFRLLLERGDAEVGRQLAKQLPQAKWPTAALVRGLWLVERLLPPDELATALPPLLAWALAHPQAEVIEQALQLLPENQIADHAVKLIELATTGGNRVQLLAMLQLGGVSSAEATTALAQAAHQLSHDRWFRAAALAGIANRELDFLAALVQCAAQDRAQNADRDDLSGLLYFEVGQLLGRASSKDAWQPTWCRAMIVADALPIANRAALLMGMRQSLAARGLIASQGLREIATTADEAGQTYQESIKRLIAECHGAAMATDQEQSASQPWCILALGACRDPESTKLLLSLATGSYPLTARLAAVQALSELPDASVAQTLLSADHFTTYSPSLRETVLSALLSQKTHLPGVLAAVAGGDVPAAAIDSLRRRQLTEHGDAAIREQARELFSPASAGERAQVFQQLRDVLQLTPQAENGRVIFRKACANCHRLDREGVAVGPDLFGIRNQPKETLLLHIILPEHEIAPQYVAYSVQTSDGRVLNGLLAAETANSITLRQALGKEETVLRDDIDQMQASTLSLMPQELEKQMSKQELCDLLAYLKGEAAGE
jgi:putative heme-binding domain-containing protein